MLIQLLLFNTPVNIIDFHHLYPFKRFEIQLSDMALLLDDNLSCVYCSSIYLQIILHLG